MIPAGIARALVFGSVLTSAACTSFATPRSAVVRPGWDVGFQASKSTMVGKDAGWFWALDCWEESCDIPVGSLELSIAHGTQNGDGTGGRLGMGLNGTNLYVEGYRQLRGPTAQHPGRTAIGVGGRAGVPGFHWSEHRIFARADLKMSPGVTLLVNPGLLLNTGSSPNGDNPGSFLAVTQGFGLEFRLGETSWTPFITWVGGWTRRTDSGRTGSAVGTSFVVSGMSVTF